MGNLTCVRVSSFVTTPCLFVRWSDWMEYQGPGQNRELDDTITFVLLKQSYLQNAFSQILPKCQSYYIVEGLGLLRWKSLELWTTTPVKSHKTDFHLHQQPGPQTKVSSF